MEDVAPQVEEAQLTSKEGASNTSEEEEETSQDAAASLQPHERPEQTVAAGAGQEEDELRVTSTAVTLSPLACRESIQADGERGDDDDDAAALELMMQSSGPHELVPATATTEELVTEVLTLASLPAAFEMDVDASSTSPTSASASTAPAEEEEAEVEAGEAEAEAEVKEAEVEAAAAVPSPQEVPFIGDEPKFYFRNEIIIEDDEDDDSCDEKPVEVIVIDDDDDDINDDKAKSTSAAAAAEQQDESAMELETSQTTSEQTAVCDPGAEVQVKQEQEGNEEHKGLSIRALCAKVEKKEEDEQNDVEVPRGDESLDMGDGVHDTEDEWLAHLPSFVAPYTRPQDTEISIGGIEATLGDAKSCQYPLDVLNFLQARLNTLVREEKEAQERLTVIAHNLSNGDSLLDKKWRNQFPWSESIRDTLSRIYKFTQFRPMQEEAINAALAGEDIFILMTTGSGKSLCYEIPALYSEGVTVVISPLKSLMTDQYNRLHPSFTQTLVKALHSDLPADKHKEIVRELRNSVEASRVQLKLLYLAPETFYQPYAQDVLKKLYEKGFLTRFVVDEAHVVDEWEHFRPEYAVPITTATATAPPRVFQAVCKQLKLRNPVFVIHNPPRKELSPSVIERSRGVAQLVEWIKTHWPDGCGIVYALTIKKVEKIYEALKKAGIAAGVYHSKKMRKDYVQTQWMADECKVMVATSAFGMGIDKPDVRFVVFYNLPRSVEQFVQGAGRAGRDGQIADCVIFWRYEDKKDVLNVQRANGGKGLSKEEMVKSEEDLNTLLNFCQNWTDCRKDMIAKYLASHSFDGQPELYRCGNLSETEGTCDNCLRRVYGEEEMTVEQESALKLAAGILQVVNSVNKKYDSIPGTGPICSITTILDIGYASMKPSIQDNDLHLLEGGLFALRMPKRRPKREEVKRIIEQMLVRGILREGQIDDRPTILPGPRRDCLSRMRFEIRQDKAVKKPASQKGPKGEPSVKGKEKEAKPENEGKKKKKKPGRKKKAKGKEIEEISDDDAVEEVEQQPTLNRKRRRSVSSEADDDVSGETAPKRRTISASNSPKSSSSSSSKSSQSSQGLQNITRAKPRAAKLAACEALVKKEKVTDKNPYYVVDEVVDECTKRNELFVKWEDWPPESNTWEKKEEFIKTASALYKRFLRRRERELATAGMEPADPDKGCTCRRCAEESTTTTKGKKKKKSKTTKKARDEDKDEDEDEDGAEDEKKKKQNKRKANSSSKASQVAKKKSKPSSAILADLSSDTDDHNDRANSSYEEDESDDDERSERRWKKKHGAAVKNEGRIVLNQPCEIIDDDSDNSGSTGARPSESDSENENDCESEDYLQQPAEPPARKRLKAKKEKKRVEKRRGTRKTMRPRWAPKPSTQLSNSRRPAPTKLHRRKPRPVFDDGDDTPATAGQLVAGNDTPATAGQLVVDLTSGVAVDTQI